MHEGGDKGRSEKTRSRHKHQIVADDCTVLFEHTSVDFFGLGVVKVSFQVIDAHPGSNNSTMSWIIGL